MNARQLFTQFKTELNLFYLALSFFSRIPVPASMQYSPELLNQSSRYFSLVGLLLAGILSVSFILFSSLFSADIAIALIMIFSLLLTGAFHEDGLADMADGIGGGMEVQQRLTIMKDSRIGTYGTVSLIMSLLLKFLLLVALSQQQILIIGLLIGYTLSRALAMSLLSSLPYVSDIDTSKSKPLANQQSTNERLILIGIAVIPLLLVSLSSAFVIVLSLLVLRFFFVKWLKARLGGYTGDCLGACQQLAELLIYLALLASYTPQAVSITNATNRLM